MPDRLRASFAGAPLILESLDVAATRGGDLTAAIYARLFGTFPETEPLFVMDRGGQVRGSMLAHVFDTIFDFIGERRYAHRFIGAEIVTHDGYGVDPVAFAAFFGIVRDEVRAACSQEWTGEMEGAWQALLAQLDEYVAGPEA